MSNADLRMRHPCRISKVTDADLEKITSKAGDTAILVPVMLMEILASMRLNFRSINS